MAKQTFLVLELLVQPRETVQVLGRPQCSRLRPFRLRIDPSIAPYFMIHDVKVGTRSMFPKSQDLPAAQFMFGNGEPFDCEELGICQDFMMIVTNGSRKPLPFIATWACLIVPPRSRGEENPFEAMYGGAEDFGTRIDQVPEIGQRVGPAPAPKVRDHPGFGWDPGY
jgi:hypothetical protein